MAVFYHNVGTEGASTDFPKTVFNKINVHALRKAISPSIIHTEILTNLKGIFQTGEFNAWGVPAGAHRVIRDLREGDYVFLIETISAPGFIPALCEVKYFPRNQNPEISKFLWGSSHFPYLFFFSTKHLDLTWIDFRDAIGFSPNYRPPGIFHNVKNERLNKWGGSHEFIDHIRSKYGKAGPAVNELLIMIESENEPFLELYKYRDQLLARSSVEGEQLAKSRLGQGSFREALLQTWEGCSVTGIQIPEMLIASHIKPWSNSTDEEKLDPFNGLLLTPNLDKLFEEGFITFDYEGKIEISPRLDASVYRQLAVSSNMQLRKIEDQHMGYLKYHRDHKFKKQ